jgi:hypothetical protein
VLDEAQLAARLEDAPDLPDRDAEILHGAEDEREHDDVKARGVERERLDPPVPQLDRGPNSLALQALAGAVAHPVGGLDGDDLGAFRVMAGVEPGAGPDLQNATPRPARHGRAERIDLARRGRSR